MSKENKKICPLLSCRSAVNPENNVNEEIFCQKDKCAWWIKGANECAVVGLAQALDYQAGTVRDILNYSATPEKFKVL